jgi:hypothetical protein
MKKLLFIAIVVVIGAVVFLRHGVQISNVQSVSDVLANAPQLIGKHIVVDGIAGNNVAIFGVGGFEIDGDGGSRLAVISSSGVPLTGTHVSIKGVLRQAWASGATQKLVLIQDSPEPPSEHSAK